MQIAELFVSLGIKGADKTIGALGDVQKGLKGVSSMSLEAKAGIAAALYALQHFVFQSGAAGTNLSNFSAYLGENAKTLQQYQYAARQVGVSNQETENTFKTLQNQMTKTRYNGQAPSGLGQVGMKTGGFTSQDVARFMDAPEKLLLKLQEYAQKEKSIGLRNENLKSFGLSDQMVAALSKGTFNQQNFSKAPTYSEKEINSLDRANIAWSNLGNKIEMAVGHFNALHGGQLVNDISTLTDKVLKLAEAFLKVADALKIFQLVGKAFEGWSAIFEGITASVDYLKNASESNDGKSKGKDQNAKQSEISEIIHGMWESFKETKPLGTNDLAPDERKALEKPKDISEISKGLLEIFKKTQGIKAESNINGGGLHAGFFQEALKNTFAPSEKRPELLVPQRVLTEKTNESKPVIIPGKQSTTTVIGGKQSTTTIIGGKNESPRNSYVNPGHPEKKSVFQPSEKSVVPTLRLVVPSSPALPAAQKGSVEPKVSAAAGDSNLQNLTVNQTVNFVHEDGQDTRKVADALRRELNNALRQSSATVRGS